MPLANIKEYRAKVAGYDKEELTDELHKLRGLLSSVTQEYRDREETIFLIVAQIDAVQTRLSDYENPSF